MKRVALFIIACICTVGTVQPQTLLWEASDSPGFGDATIVPLTSQLLVLRLPMGWFGSSDGGDTWTSLPDFVLSVTTSTDRFYAITTSGVMSFDNFVDIDSWTHHGLTGKNVRSIRVHQSGDLWAWVDDTIQKSEDAGLTWSTKQNGLDDSSFGCDISSLSTPEDGHVYVGSDGCGPNGVGATVSRWNVDEELWQRLETQDGNALWGKIRKVVTTPDGRVFATAVSNTYWRKAGLNVYDGSPFRNLFGTDIPSASLAPNGDLLLGTSHGVLTLPLGESTWFKSGLDNIPVTSLKVTPDGSVYAASRSYCFPVFDPPSECRAGFGLYRKAAGDSVFSVFEHGMPSASINAMTTSDDGVLVGTQNGLWIQASGHNSYIPLAIGIENNLFSADSLVSVFDPHWTSLMHLTPWGTLFASNYNSGYLYKYESDASVWTPTNLPAFYLQSPTDVKSVLPNVILAAFHDTVFRSVDNGETWQAVVTDGYGSSLFVASTGRTLFFGTDLYSSLDSGVTWTELENAPSLVTMTEGHTGILYGAGNGQFFSSDNVGDVWEFRSVAPNFRTLIADDFGNLWGSTTVGVWGSFDGGLSWTESPLPPSVEITHTVLDANNRLYVGTRSHGIFRSTTATSVGVSNDILPRLDVVGVYPNPFRDLITISFTGVEHVQSRITIFDVLGRRHYESAPRSGSFEIEVDVSRLAAGIYLVRLETPTQSMVTKVIKH